MESYVGDVWLVRLLFQRGLAAIYLIAFVVVLRQFRPLLGERGLLPVPAFLARRPGAARPSLFSWRYSDRILGAVGWAGVLLSIAALLGWTERGPLWVSLGAWLTLWFLYLSIVNVGQQFYGFGWESMLLEAGFFAAFLGPAAIEPSLIPVLCLRWMLFRTEIGAGLIKLRHDECWRSLTCLYYHYETQPVPNPLSWYFHRLPRIAHRAAVLCSHVVQIVVPFALFAPQPYAAAAGGLIVFHQLWLIVSGNYSWLNWLTVALGVTACSDATLSAIVPVAVPGAGLPRPLPFDLILYALGVATIMLSVAPVRNLLSREQSMNRSYNRYHLVNTYGAFGRVTRTRYEIVLEGTDDAVVTRETHWQEYGFKAKPGDPRRRPPQLAPFHRRLDWLMWFLPFSIDVTPTGIARSGYEAWFMSFVRKLLEDDHATLRLLAHNPLAGRRPQLVRALLYEYRFTDRRERAATGAWWTRRYIDVYLPPVSLATLSRSWRAPGSA